MERSKRSRNKPVRFSPPPSVRRKLSSVPKKNTGSEDSIVYGDVLSDGSLFSCEKCSSTFLDSRYRGTRKSVNVVYPSIRYSQSGSHLVLCRPCGTQHDQAKLVGRAPAEESTANSKSDTNGRGHSAAEREIIEFTKSVVTLTKTPEAAQLTCYNPSNQCHCMTDYLKSLDFAKLCEEVKVIVNVSKKADDLRQLKVDNLPAGLKNRKVGLGNGKKRSQLYEDFVLKEREKMKNNLNLCEHTVQKLLHYSNNFLHKRLLTEQRRTRVGGQTKVKLLPVTQLWKHQCCRDRCTRITRTHLNRVVKWRQLSQESRRGLQQAIAELLTPSAGAKTNCYKFIAMVTGSSAATISKVTKKMRKNGGVLGMQEHGLVKYWRSQRGMVEEGEESADEDQATVWALPQHHADEVELRQTVDKQNKQLKELKQQLEKQQKEIEQQNSQLSSLITKQNFYSSMLKSPTNFGWPGNSQLRSSIDQSSSWLSNVGVGRELTSPQYPPKVTGGNSSRLLLTTTHHASSSAVKPILQPSKLDSSLRTMNSSMLESNSYVLATDKSVPAYTQETLQAEAMHQDCTVSRSLDQQSANSDTYFSSQLPTRESALQFGSHSQPLSYAMSTNFNMSQFTAQYSNSQSTDSQSWQY